jgi:hypothetical protein
MADSCLLDRGRFHGQPGSDPANRLQSRIFGKIQPASERSQEVTGNPVTQELTLLRTSAGIGGEDASGLVMSSR